MNKPVRFRSLFTNESGASLVLALVISSILFLLIATVVLFGNTDMKVSRKQDAQLSALYIAEAGVERAIQDINTSLSSHTLIEDYQLVDIEFFGGSYTVNLDEKNNEHGENVGWLIISEGSYQGENRKINVWVRQKVQNSPSLNVALYGEEKIKIETLSGYFDGLVGGLLGTVLGKILETHPILIDGDVHANDELSLKHHGLLTSDPTVNGCLSSTSLGNIKVEHPCKKVSTAIPMPEFDFDYARELAKKEGRYVSGEDELYISLLGLTSDEKIIFVEGDLDIVGLDLLGISLNDRTLVVNGSISGNLSLGGSLFSKRLNMIAKENIKFTGAVTGLQVDGILFAQGIESDPNSGKVEVAGHAEVNGFTGGRNIDMGAGILSSLLGIVTGKMHFQSNPAVFDAFEHFSRPIGFKSNEVEIIEWKEE